MKWLTSMARVLGVSSPFTAWLVQVDAEQNAAQVDARLNNLDDQISNLHEGIAPLSKVIYTRLRQAESNSIDLEMADHE